MKKKVLLLVLSLVISIICISIIIVKINGNQQIPYTNITVEKFNSKLHDNETFYVYIYKTSCTACNSFKPVLTEVINEKHIQLYGLKVDGSSDISFLKDNDIQEVPCVRKYEKGKVQKSNVGVLSKNELSQFLN